MAKGFDVERRTIVGNAEVVAGTVGDASPESPAAFSASQTGVLAYSPWAGPRHQLTYEDIHGQTVGSFGHPGVYMHPRFSPDGQEVAVSRLDDSTGRVGCLGVEHDHESRRRLTSQPRFSAAPAWSPDGRRIAYMARSAAGKEDFDIFVRSADGTGPETCLVCAPDMQTGAEWTPDGRFVLYESVSPRSVAIWAMRAEAGHVPDPLLAARFATLGPRVSPDGHWLAYMSDESGRHEVYVREFQSDGDVPRVGAAWMVSVAGGREPRWRPDGRALYYVAPDRHLMTASVGSGRTPFSGAPDSLGAFLRCGARRAITDAFRVLRRRRRRRKNRRLAPDRDDRDAVHRGHWVDGACRQIDEIAGRIGSSVRLLPVGDRRQHAPAPVTMARRLFP